jgi:hypothetical protein
MLPKSTEGNMNLGDTNATLEAKTLTHLKYFLKE